MFCQIMIQMLKMSAHCFLFLASMEKGNPQARLVFGSFFVKSHTRLVTRRKNSLSSNGSGSCEKNKKNRNISSNEKIEEFLRREIENIFEWKACNFECAGFGSPLTDIYHYHFHILLIFSATPSYQHAAIPPKKHTVKWLKNPSLEDGIVA